MLKKIVSLVVGATLVLATLGVAAADVATTSVYNVADDTIAVTTNVTNANAGEVYTYLAYKLADGGSLANLQNNEVVYVDEKVIAEGATSTSFTYTTAAANDQAVVLLGNPTTDAVIDGGIIEGAIMRNYTVAVGDGVAAAGNVDITGLEDTDLVLVRAALASAIVTGVKVNGEAVDFLANNEGVQVALADLPENAAVVVEVSTGVQQTVVTVLDGAYVPAEDAAAEDGLNYSSAFVLAKIEGSASEYGVKFGPAQDNFEVFTAPALGQGSDGLFAIRVYGFEEMDEEHKIDDGLFIWTKAYAVVEGNTIYSDDFCRIRLAAE